jgi:Leucine-rich repeat (LRR) protein
LCEGLSAAFNLELHNRENSMNLRLVGLVLVSLIAGCHQPTREEQAIAEVERLGGDVKKDGRVAGMPVTSVNLAGSKVTDGELQVVKRFPQLQSLDLRETRISDRGLEHLEKMTKLQELYLDRTPITDLGLAHLQGLKELRKLTLTDTRISDFGLESLKGLTKLAEVSLKETKVSEKAADRLREQLPDVKVIH